MDSRTDALLQIRTMVAGRLSVRAYLAWRDATREKVAALEDAEFARLVALVDTAIDEFGRREIPSGERLREVLRARIAEAELVHLMTEALLKAVAKPG